MKINIKFINRKFVWLILSLIMFSFQANGQEKTFDESVLSDKGREAYQILLKTQLFAFSGSDYNGMPVNGDKALYVLLKEKKSSAAFRNLIDKATPEGGLYALLGLRDKKCKCFDEEFQKFIKMAEIPQRVRECLVCGQMKIKIAIPEGSVGRSESRRHFFYERKFDVANDIKAGKFDGSIKREEKL